MTDQLARFCTNLAEIADSYAQLAAQHRESIRDERVKPGHERRHREAKGSPLIYGQPTGNPVVADPVAHAMPSGPAKERRNAPVVGGSREAPVPVSLDLVDVTGEARRGSLDVADTSPWPEDQIGYLAFATELDFWVRDIADLLGDPLPAPVVPVLAMWLRERAGWAWDHYGAVEEMALKVGGIAKTLHAMTNPRRPRPEPKAAPCPACEQPTLSGDGEWVRCSMDGCGRVLTEAEYLTWSRLVLIRRALGGDGITAREISIRWNKPMGTVHRLAHQHEWKRTADRRRPVLYLKAQVEEDMAALEVRNTAAKVA